MLKRTLFAALMLLLAGTGLVGADTPPNCSKSPPRDETQALPFGYYVRIADGEGLTLWEETNDTDGLQIEKCRDALGAVHYQADERVGVGLP